MDSYSTYSTASTRQGTVDLSLFKGHVPSPVPPFSGAVPLPPSLYLSVVNSTTLEARWSLLPEEKSPVSGFKLRLREQGSLMTEPIVLPNSSFSYVLYDLSECGHDWGLL